MRRTGTASPHRWHLVLAVVGAVAVALGVGVVLWDQLGILGVPIDVVVAIVLVRLLRPAFSPRVPAPAD